MKKAIIIILTGVFVSFAADTTSVDSSLFIKIILPQSWVYFNTSDSSAMITSLDTNYKGNLFITRYKTAGYQNAREWTQSYFTAYSEYVKNSSEPYGQLLWLDSTTSAALQPIESGGFSWAPWITAKFKTLDSAGTMVTWDEYERFTAHQNFGYEMYAISDTVDMNANYKVYASILQKIVLLDNSVGVIFHPIRFHGGTASFNSSKNDPGWYTITGRRMVSNKLMMSSGIYINRKARITLLRP